MFRRYIPYGQRYLGRACSKLMSEDYTVSKHFVGADVLKSRSRFMAPWSQFFYISGPYGIVLRICPFRMTRVDSVMDSFIWLCRVSFNLFRKDDLDL